VNAVAAVALGATSTGCGLPRTPAYAPNRSVGIDFCTELAASSQLISTQEFGVGVFLLTLGGASITASGVMASISANSENYRELLGYAGAAFAVAPLVAVPFGMVLLSRSDEASALSAAANTAVALSDDDKDAYRDCVLAKAAWIGSRSDATALARKALEDKEEKGEKDEPPEPASPPSPSFKDDHK
jgi:hypothetical protein